MAIKEETKHALSIILGLVLAIISYIFTSALLCVLLAAVGRPEAAVAALAVSAVPAYFVFRKITAKARRFAAEREAERVNRLREKEAEREAAIEQWANCLALGGGPAALEDLNIDKFFRPKKGEKVHYFAQNVNKLDWKTKTERYNYGGFGVRLKIVDGLYYRAGSISLKRVNRECLESQGRGVLIITNKRVIFNSYGSAKSWTKTWNSILTWEMFSDAIKIELTNQRPIFLEPAITDPFFEPIVIGAALEGAFPG